MRLGTPGRYAAPRSPALLQLSRLTLARPSLGFFPGGFLFLFFNVEMNHGFIFIFLLKLEMNHKIICSVRGKLLPEWAAILIFR